MHRELNKGYRLSQLIVCSFENTLYWSPTFEMASGEDGSAAATQKTSIRQLSEFILERPPSCIEFIPKSGPRCGNLLVVGTYELQNDEFGDHQADEGSAADPTTPGGDDPKAQKRKGSLSLLKISPVNNKL